MAGGQRPTYRLLLKNKDTGETLEAMAFWPAPFKGAWNGRAPREGSPRATSKLGELAAGFYFNLVDASRAAPRDGDEAPAPPEDADGF